MAVKLGGLQSYITSSKLLSTGCLRSILRSFVRPDTISNVEMQPNPIEESNPNEALEMDRPYNKNIITLYKNKKKQIQNFFI